MNVLNIYVGPFLRVKKQEGMEMVGGRLAKVCLPEEKTWDVYMPYGAGAKPDWDISHRDVGNDHLVMEDVEAKILKFKEYAERSIKTLEDAYGEKATFHYGVITSWG